MIDMKNTGRSNRRRALADALVDSVYAIRAAEVAQLGVICDLIDAYDTVPILPGPGTPRLVRSGGDGTPKVDEFLINELHPLLGIGPITAWALLRDAINLRDRHPHTWQLTQTLAIPIWQARHVAHACSEPSAEAAGIVDTKITPSLGATTWARAKKRLNGLIASTDVELAAQKAAAAREDRFVSIKHVGDGTSWLLAT